MQPESLSLSQKKEKKERKKEEKEKRTNPFTHHTQPLPSTTSHKQATPQKKKK